MAGNRLDIVIKAIDKASGTLNKIGVEIGKQKAAVAGMNVVSQQYTQRGTQMTAASAGLTMALAATGRQAAMVDQSMRDVNSIAKVTEQSLSGLTTSVLDIARDPKVVDTPAKLSAGLYDLYSSGLQGAAAMDTLRIASKGAAAGQADTSAAATVLSGVMNAYNTKTGPDAIRIMDALFKTVEVGNVRFPELAASLGTVTSTAASVGVGIEEVGAAIAVMTNKGIAAPEAITALNNVLMQFLSPNKAFQAAMAASGYQTGLQILQARGLAGSIEWLSRVTGENQAEQARLIGEVRGIKGVFSLAANGGELFTEALTELRSAAGATDSALEEQSKGAMFQWKVAMKDLNIAAVTFGKTLLPVMAAVSRTVSAAARGFDKLPTPLKSAAAGTLVAATGGLALAGAYNLAAGAVTGMMAKMTAARATQAVMAADGIRTATVLSATWTWAAQRSSAAWAWMTAQSAIGWRAQWAMAATRVPALKGLFLGLFTTMKTGALGAWGALSKLPAVMAATGKALVAFLLSPAGVVIAALAVLTYELYKLYGVYKEMRSAQKDAQKSAAQAKAMDEEYGVKRDKTGAILSIARTAGAQSRAAPVAATRPPTAATQTPNWSAIMQAAEKGDATPLNALLKAQERAATPAPDAPTEQAAGSPYGAAQAQQAPSLRMVPATSERIVSANDQYGRVFSFTFNVQANSADDVKRIAGQAIDEAFRM